MATYKTFIASQQQQIHVVDEFQQKIKKKKYPKTLSQTWALPLSRETLVSLMYRKMLHVSTTIDEKTVIGYSACLSRIQASEFDETLITDVCEAVHDPNPVFVTALLSLDCNQQDVLYSLLKQSFDQLALQSHYFQTMVVITQLNAYLNEYMRSFGYMTHQLVIGKPFKPAISVFTIKLAY
jgi:hypothetical protein